jgi:periplasmic protein TonB
VELNSQTNTARGTNTIPAGANDSDDLPRFCLEQDPVESKKTLAWVNSICLVYLIIGFIGLKPPPIVINKRPEAQEEAVPVLVEPLVTAVPTVTAESTPEQVEASREESGAGVAVVMDSPAVAFSVPTVGNVLVPLSMAQAPPAHPMQATTPISSVHIEQINVTGIGGNRPPPMYPMASIMAKEQGTVILSIEVGESGRVDSVTVKQSSGYSRLDKAAAEHVRRAWFFSPARGKRVYECPIVFQLQ